MKVLLRISNKGVPHTLIELNGVTYSICFFGRDRFYRVWQYDPNEFLFDVVLEPGEEVDFEKEIKDFLEEVKKKNKVERGIHEDIN